MWKKTDTDLSTSKANTSSMPDTDSSSDGSVGSVGRRRKSASDGAVIGSSIVIKGDITGDENLLIMGRVEGNVNLEEHTIVVGESGDIQANLTARDIEIDGQVEGDITGREKITIRASGRVKGDIKAPKVVLEEGSQFRGAVEMDVDATRYSSDSSSTSKVSSISDSDKAASA